MKQYFTFFKVVLYIFIFSSGILFAETEFPPFQNPSVVSPRISGLGVPYTTFEAGIDSLFTNPASFGFLKKRVSFGKIATSANDAVFNSFSVLDAPKKKEAFIENIFTGKSYDYKLRATGPLALALADKNFAVGIFNRTIIDAKIEPTVAKHLLMGEEIFITGGYGGSVYTDGSNFVALGVQMKGFFSTFSYALNSTKLELQNSAKNKFKNLPIVLLNGIGIDVGFLYKYENYFSLGLTCRDAYTAVFLTPYNSFEDYKNAKTAGKTQYTYVYPDISVGIACVPVTNEIWKTISTWSFYADYRNILDLVFNKERNPLFNLAIGSELIFHKVLSFRLGMYGLYPHFGCGLDFTYFQFDCSAYLHSTNNKIWKDPQVGLDFSLSFEY